MNDEISLVGDDIAQQAKSPYSAGNTRGWRLLVEGIHVEIWVLSETRIHMEIQGKYLNRG